MQATVRAAQFGTTLVCAHVHKGERPTGDVTLLVEGDSHYVRLCEACTRLSKVPGGLHIELPKPRPGPVPRRRTAVDDYIEQRLEEHTS
jgi:hypothetical protein